MNRHRSADRRLRNTDLEGYCSSLALQIPHGVEIIVTKFYYISQKENKTLEFAKCCKKLDSAKTKNFPGRLVFRPYVTVRLRLERGIGLGIGNT